MFVEASVLLESSTNSALAAARSADVLEYGATFVREASAASGDRSYPIAGMFLSLAAKTVVPAPTNGSTIWSFSESPHS